MTPIQKLIGNDYISPQAKIIAEEWNQAIEDNNLDQQELFSVCKKIFNGTESALFNRDPLKITDLYKLSIDVLKNLNDVNFRDSSEISLAINSGNRREISRVLIKWKAAELYLNLNPGTTPIQGGTVDDYLVYKNSADKNFRNSANKTVESLLKDLKATEPQQTPVKKNFPEIGITDTFGPPYSPITTSYGDKYFYTFGLDSRLRLDDNRNSEKDKKTKDTYVANPRIRAMGKGAVKVQDVGVLGMYIRGTADYDLAKDQGQTGTMGVDAGYLLWRPTNQWNIRLGKDNSEWFERTTTDFFDLTLAGLGIQFNSSNKEERYKFNLNTGIFPLTSDYKYGPAMYVAQGVLNVEKNFTFGLGYFGFPHLGETSVADLKYLQTTNTTKTDTQRTKDKQVVLAYDYSDLQLFSTYDWKLGNNGWGLKLWADSMLNTLNRKESAVEGGISPYYKNWYIGYKRFRFPKDSYPAFQKTDTQGYAVSLGYRTGNTFSVRLEYKRSTPINAVVTPVSGSLLDFTYKKHVNDSKKNIDERIRFELEFRAF